MTPIFSFVEYVLLKEEDRRTGAKTGLYPLGYGGIGLYPDSDYMTHSADAILYVTQDRRLYHNGDNHPFDITHIAGHKQWGDKINSGERDPFPIHQLPGKPVPPKNILKGETKRGITNNVPNNNLPMRAD